MYGELISARVSLRELISACASGENPIRIAQPAIIDFRLRKQRIERREGREEEEEKGWDIPNLPLLHRQIQLTP